MSELNDLLEAARRRVRGPGKRPSLVCTSIRLSQKTMAYFNALPDKQAAMRRVLDNYVDQQLQAQELNHGSQETFQE